MKRILNYPELIFALISFFLFIIFILFISTPFIYNWIYGDKIIQDHIEDIIKNEKDHKIIVEKLLNWLKTEVPYPKEEIFAFGSFPGIYTVNEKIRIFHRDVPASWTIKEKLGRCGEDTRYFVEIMAKLSFEVREIKPHGWDHKWAEYYTKNGTKIIVDPSGFKVIEDPIEFAKNSNWTEMWAYYLNGSKENITLEYLES